MKRELVDRGQRIHDGDHVERPELFCDELDERLAHGHVVAASDVVVVEEEHEQPDVRARRLALLVVERSNLRAERGVDLAQSSIFTTLNESIVCGLPSSLTLNSSCFRSSTGLPWRSVMIDVDADEVDAGADAAAAAAILLLRLLLGRWLLGAVAGGWRSAEQHQRRRRRRSREL